MFIYLPSFSGQEITKYTYVVFESSCLLLLLPKIEASR